MTSFRAIAIIALSLIAFARQAHAQDAGCGLGSMILKDNGKLLQLFAMTTNQTTFTQTFGITSGTSNCRASSLVMNDKAIEYFAEVNKDELSREMAEGKGEKLAALASLFGCQSQDSVSSFEKMTQSSFEFIFPSATTSPEEMVRNLNREFKTSGGQASDLAAKCRTI
jgi:hypothetical protein